MYPALAVLNALQGKVDPVLWVGSETGMEADLIARTGLSYQAIPAAGLHGVGLRSLPGNLRQLARGYRSARRILRDFNPDVLLFTGGYVAVPMALAARRWRGPPRLHRDLALDRPCARPLFRAVVQQGRRTGDE